MYYAHTINGDNGCGTIHYDDRGVVRTIRVGQIECQATRDVASILEGQWIELDRAVEDEHSITGIIRCIQQGDVETAIRHEFTIGVIPAILEQLSIPRILDSIALDCVTTRSQDWRASTHKLNQN